MLDHIGASLQPYQECRLSLEGKPCSPCTGLDKFSGNLVKRPAKVDAELRSSSEVAACAARCFDWSFQQPADITAMLECSEQAVVDRAVAQVSEDRVLLEQLRLFTLGPFCGEPSQQFADGMLEAYGSECSWLSRRLLRFR